MSTLFVSDERCMHDGSSLCTETAPTGGLLDLCAEIPDLSLLVRPCPETRRNFSVKLPRTVHVRHLPDWSRRGILLKLVPVIGSVWVNGRKARRIIAVMPSFAGLAVCLLVSLRILRRPLLVLVRGHLSEQYTAQAESRGVLSKAAIAVLALVSKASIQRADVVSCVSSYLTHQFPGITCQVTPEVDWEALNGIKCECQRSGALFVGRLEEEKNPATAVRAAVAVPQEPVSLTVIGVGSLLPTLKEIAEGSPGSRIEFVGALKHEDVLHEMCHAKVVVVPSISEGFGLVALEAVAAGAAVVCADTGGLPEAVGWSSSAHFVRGSDPLIWHREIVSAMGSASNLPPPFNSSFRQQRGWAKITEVLRGMGSS